MRSKKPIVLAIAIMLASIISIIYSRLVFSSLPNVQEFTPKEAMQATLATILIILGIVGFISGFIIMYLDE